MAADFDPKTCPVGIANEKSIDITRETLTLMIQHLNEKIDDMKESLTSQMNSGFENVNSKLDGLEQRFNNLEDGLDEKIEEKISQKRDKVSAKFVGWIFGGMGAAVVIAVVTKWVLHLLNLS